MELPTSARRREYLEKQKEEMLMANFRNQVARSLYTRKIEDAKEANDRETIRRYEDELEKVDEADKGNNVYLEILESYLKDLK